MEATGSTPGPDSPPQPQSTGAQAASATTGATSSNKWDFLKDATRAALALGALVYLTVFLVRHYTDVKDASAILGIVVPVLGAALGATLGYAGGTAVGKADKDQAVKQGRRALARQLRQPAREAQQRLTDQISGPLKTASISPPGSRVLRLVESSEFPQGVPLETEALDATEQRMTQVNSILDTVENE